MFTSGTILLNNGMYFYVNKGKLYQLVSKRAAESWHSRPVEVGELPYPPMGKLGFRDRTLIKDVSTSKIYVIDESKKRHVINPDSLGMQGLRMTDCVVVSRDEANFHKDGEDL